MSRLCGAGILPFCRVDGKVLFLLAKERYVPHWRGSSRWSGFEGGVKNDETAAENAVREFCEESILVMEADPGTLEREIDESNYAMRINILTESRRAQNAAPSLHATFVKEFEHDPDLPRKFEERRSQLVELQQVGEDLKKLARALPRSGFPFFCEGHPILISGVPCRVRAVLGVALGTHAFSARLELEDGCGVVRTKTVTARAGDIDLQDAAAYKAWFDCRCRCEALLAATTAPDSSFIVQRHPCGTLRSLHVPCEYLEKTCIRYWDLDELTQCLKRHPHPLDVFRPYFVLVIRTVLERFSLP